MVKKVTLDTLDIEETSVSMNEKPPEVTAKEDKPPVRWFVSRWFRLACIAFVMLSCVVGLSSWWMSSRKTAPPSPVVKVVKSAPFQGKQNIEFVNDFLIPLKADKGNQRILMFDLAFELNTGQQSRFIENMVRVRSSIYQTVSKKTTNIPLSPGGMNVLRDEIIAELESYLGKGTIKTVYFTRFLVL